MEDQRDWEIKDKIETIIQRHRLTVNFKKSKWFKNNNRDNCIVTGVRIHKENIIPREFHRTVRAKLQNLAKEHSDIDAETQGCLAYIKSVDEKRYRSLLQYYQRRRDYEPAQ